MLFGNGYGTTRARWVVLLIYTISDNDGDQLHLSRTKIDSFIFQLHFAFSKEIFVTGKNLAKIRLRELLNSVAQRLHTWLSFWKIFSLFPGENEPKRWKNSYNRSTRTQDICYCGCSREFENRRNSDCKFPSISPILGKLN